MIGKLARRVARPLAANLSSRLGLALLAICGSGTEARASAAGAITFATNPTFRGESITTDSPAIVGAISLDGPEGTFAGASVTIALAQTSGPRVSNTTQYAGIAHRWGNLSVEAGMIHRSYAQIVDEDYRRGFFEGYLGVTRGKARLRLYLSPDYQRNGRASYYGEVEAQLFQTGPWSADVHAGLSLIPTDDGQGGVRKKDYHDWQLRLSRPIGRVRMSVGIAGTDYPVYSASGRARVFASFSTTL